MNRIESLLHKQRRSLDGYFNSIDLGAVERVLTTLQECSGELFFTGVGKSGLIAKKIAATFISIGISSRYLSTADALHGDIGAVKRGDVVLAFSKSGQTQELLDLLPHVLNRGARAIAVVSRRGSALEKLSSQTIYLPLDEELCPLDLVPTTSTVIQLLFGDLLAIALMEWKNVSISAFGENHPAGLLGRKITRRVADLMLTGDALPICRPTDRLIDVLHELSGKKCGSLMVLDEQKRLQGIFTDGDLRRAIQQKGPAVLEVTISELMTVGPKAISPDKRALDAMNVMEEDPARPVTVLPVLEKGKVVGLLRMHDILQ